MLQLDSSENSGSEHEFTATNHATRQPEKLNRVLEEIPEIEVLIPAGISRNKRALIERIITLGLLSSRDLLETAELERA